MDYLQQYSLVWQYVPGPKNVADPLTRMPHFYLAATTRRAAVLQDSASAQNRQHGELMDAIRSSYTSDPCFSPQGLEQAHGIYYKDERIVVPNVGDLRERILRECHESMFAGHMGRDKTYDIVARLF